MPTQSSGTAPRHDEADHPGYRALRAGIGANERGDAKKAIAHFEAAERWGRRRRDIQLVDRAQVNRIAAELQLGWFDGQATRLQQILMRNHEPELCFLAAYNTSRVYETEGNDERAIFYAQIARKWCLKTERVDWMAWSRNQMGNLHLARSSFDEACDEYEVALELMPIGRSVPRAIILDNLGYCQIIREQLADGFDMLFESLRTLIAFDAPRHEMLPRLTLCYAYLELGRHEYAIRHGERALDLARDHGEETTAKNALYLLGQAYNLSDDEFTAKRYFRQLQEAFYPGQSELPDFLLAYDVRQLINLKA